MVTFACGGAMGLAILASVTTMTRSAHAEERRRALWTIEARPWPCARLVAALASEVELACDASGGTCHVAAAEDAPTCRAVLGCEADEAGPWTLSAQTASGEEIWKVTLDGETEQRLRKGALWVARTPAPEPPLAARAWSPPAPVPQSPETPAPQPEEEDLPTPPNGGLTLEAFYKIGTDATRATGARGTAVLRGTGLARYGLAFAVESESLFAAGPVSAIQRNGWSGLAGALLTVGAPWTDNVAGLTLEGGLATGARSGQTWAQTCTSDSYPVETCSNSASSSVSESFVSPYAAASLVLQVPARLPLNLWTAATVTWDALYYRESQFFFTFSLGASWRAW